MTTKKQSCKCGKEIPRTAYVIAQRAMNIILFYTCPVCKEKTEVY